MEKQQKKNRQLHGKATEKKMRFCADAQQLNVGSIWIPPLDHLNVKGTITSCLIQTSFHEPPDFCLLIQRIFS